MTEDWPSGSIQEFYFRLNLEIVLTNDAEILTYLSISIVPRDHSDITKTFFENWIETNRLTI